MTIDIADRRTSAPKTFQFSSGAFRDDHLQDFTPEECGSPGSEFSLTHEWHHMLEAGTAAGMSTRDSSGNDSDYENPYDALNGSEFGLGSAATSMSRSHAQVVRKPSRTRSMELPPKSRGHDGSGSGLLKDEKSQFMAHHITTLPRHSAPLMNRDQSQGVNYGKSLNVHSVWSLRCLMMRCEAPRRMPDCDSHHSVLLPYCMNAAVMSRYE